MIVLPRIIRQRLFAQFTTCPGQVKRMLQEVVGRDFLIDGIKIFVHKILSESESVYKRSLQYRKFLMCHAGRFLRQNVGLFSIKFG